MYLDSHHKIECCGCSACSNVCPKHIIRMVRDEEGFAYPQITNEKECIHCDKCRRVCSFVNPPEVCMKPSCYAGWLEDDNQRRLSTSGGAFMAIANAAKRCGLNMFYGAVYDEGKVIHKGFPFEQISELRGTKYLQSDIGSCYAEIKEILANGSKVMFVGTPCQVAGLQRYIGIRDRQDLLTVALVCHGVASPSAFLKYCSEMKSDMHGEVKKVVFRDKVESRPLDVPSCTTLVYSDGYCNSESANPYTTAFGLGLMQRPSCADCPFTTVYRDCDITIGDFWGIEERCPELTKELRNGISLVIAHSDRGRRIISQMEGFHLEEKPVDWAVNVKQPQLSHPHEVNSRRDKFMREVLIDNKSFVKTANREILRWRIENKIRRIAGR